MSSSFPPGPYSISWRKTKSPSWELRSADGRILTSSNTIIPEDEIEALGRLLKAAPDLLAAARDAQAAIASNDSQRELALRQAKEQLDAAIAKALGV